MTANRMLKNALNLKGAIVENFSFGENVDRKDAQRNPVAR